MKKRGDGVKQAGTVFSYVRWSSAGQELGDSEHRQLEAANPYAEQHGLALSDEVYDDRGVSAWKGDHRRSGRHGQLLNKAVAGDHILIESVSRWSREHQLDSLDALREATDRGVTIHFTSHGMTVDSSNPKNLFGMLSLHAQLSNAENDEKAKRIKAAMDAKRQKLAEGVIVFGRLPAWLTWNHPARPRRADRAVVVVPEKVAIVNHIYQLCIGGHGCQGIARLLAKTAPIANSRRTHGWNTKGIYRLLTDRSVLGYHDASDKKVYPQVIDEPTFYGAAKRLQERKNYTVPVVHQNKNLFTNLLFCTCGRSLVRQSSGYVKGGKRYSYRYLMCSGGVRHEKGCTCGCKGVRYEVLATSILSVLTMRQEVRDALEGRTQEPDAVAVLKVRLESNQARANKILAMIDGMDKPPKALAVKLAALEQEEAGLLDQIGQEEAKRKPLPSPSLAHSRLLEHDLSDPIKIRDRASVRLLLRDIVQRIDVDIAAATFTVHHAQS